MPERTAVPPPSRPFLDLLFGRPLPSDADTCERVGPLAGIPIFGLDALSSAAYGPEAALTILLAAGTAGVAYVWPITLAIIVLLGIVYFSYNQTIAAYPQGGGSYSVASDNLGDRVGVVAGAALMIDYILNVAVGISAGVGALVSAVPVLQPHTLALCLGILATLTLINLRGLREAGIAFMAPTYAFVACLAVTITIGAVRVFSHGGHPASVAQLPKPHAAAAAVTAWLLVKAFASGCTAMTGVEAVSNGVQVFRKPTVEHARVTLTAIILILVVLLAGIAYLARAYGIMATPPQQPGYESVLSQLAAAVNGRGVFYYITIAAVLSVLVLSANTSFADFPRVCRAIAEKGYLPYPFTFRGRRLVFSFGVYTLALLAGLLLIVFGGITDRLIPLFAVGAFTAFTLSQAGMVVHWRKKKGRGWRSSMAVNAIGALATGSTTCTVIVAKFIEGAWITVLAIPGLIALMLVVRRHYNWILRDIDFPSPAKLTDLEPPIVVMPMQRWSKVAEKALRFAYTLSQDVVLLHIAPETHAGHENKDELLSIWEDRIQRPAAEAGLRVPQLVVLRSPYRLVVTPIFDQILKLQKEHQERLVAVILPELVERKWYYYLLHNQRSAVLKIMLFLKGNERIIVVNVPWYLQ